jgi:rubrerythrin
MNFEDYVRVNQRFSCLGLHHARGEMQGVPKIKFVNEQDAMTELLKNVTNRPLRRGGWRKQLAQWTVYICGHCGYMHIGHVNQNLKTLERKNDHVQTD